MPLYTFRNKRTGEEWDDLMSISEMEKFTKKRNIELVPTSVGIVSSVCLIYTSQIPRDGLLSSMPTSA